MNVDLSETNAEIQLLYDLLSTNKVSSSLAD